MKPGYSLMTAHPPNDSQPPPSREHPPLLAAVSFVLLDQLSKSGP